MNRSWTFLDDRTLRRMWAAGASGREIASTFGVTVRSVTARRLRLGLPPRPHGRGPSNTPWTTAEDDQLMELVSTDGHTFEAIGAIMKRNRDSVKSRFRVLAQRLGPQAV